MAFGHLSSRIMGKYVSAVEDFQLEELCHSYPSALIQLGTAPHPFVV